MNFAEITAENIAQLEGQVHVDQPFAPGAADPIVGSKCGELIEAFDGSIESIYFTMFKSFIAQIVKCTNKLIMSNNLANN